MDWVLGPRRTVDDLSGSPTAHTERQLVLREGSLSAFRAAQGFSLHLTADAKEHRVDPVRRHCRKAAPILTSN